MLVAVLVGALVTSNIPARIYTGVGTAICEVSQDPGCDRPSPSVVQVSGGPRDPAHLPAHQLAGQESPDDGNCWDWLSWACSAVDGLRLGTWDVITDAWDGITFVGCLVHICSHEGFKSNWGSIGALFTTNPLTTLETIWNEATEPVRTDWNEGREVRAVFRAIPSVLGIVFGGKGLTKLKNLGKGDQKPPDPPPTRHVPAEPPDVRIMSSRQNPTQNMRVFQEAQIGDGFSGVYDTRTGHFEARLSSGPNAVVDRYGGHGKTNDEVFGGSRQTVGFVAIRTEYGYEIRWNSYSVNNENWGDRAAPQQYRQGVIDAMKAATGLEVRG
ncbi:hypothetical protein DPM19_30090 [Actinomadura craniellae]|uniref:Uncharacterized protein n=2 Tax=Actinomadura craniellae TaxID=2231787 RepID=A0A365GXI7_9ACTN|nr:hypothetical protein DPM19_30090 [Actinomadura craniellae]